MKDTIQKQLAQLEDKYGWIIGLVIRNMRLLLLCLFAGLAGYLVHRVNTLVNSEITAPDSSEAISAKSPDKDVLSTFNELYVQDVELSSNFDNSRENPF